jgi:RNA polymerase sigma-70 factor (ECF subfamily)
MTKEDERAIIERVLSGDSQAYAVLVREHHRDVLRLCLSLLGDPAKAEDAAQLAFIRAYKGLAAFAGKAAFRTWLTRIVSNTCLEMLRSERRRREDSWDALVEEEGEAAYRLLREPRSAGQELEWRDIVGRLLSGLSPESRLALTLRELNGCTYEEISLAMDCTLDSVKARLRRARLDIIDRLRIIEGCGKDAAGGSHGTR